MQKLGMKPILGVSSITVKTSKNILTGLAYMHAVAGVCHGDLKLQNEMVKICDYGSAKVLQWELMETYLTFACDLSFFWANHCRLGRILRIKVKDSTIIN